jgi:putative oxidoreductase
MKILLDFYLKWSSRFPIAWWTPIPLRLIVGYGFMEHGFAKLSRGVDSFAAILQAMGVPEPHLMARITILIELFGGFAVILGAFVAIVSMPMTALLLVAIFKVHLPYGFSSIKLLAVTASGAKFGPVGYEVNLLYIACLAALVMGGSGPFAVDRLIGDAISNYLRHSRLVALRDDQHLGRQTKANQGSRALRSLISWITTCLGRIPLRRRLGSEIIHCNAAAPPIAVEARVR